MVLQGAKKNFILKRFPKINVPGLKEIIRPTSVCETQDMKNGFGLPLYLLRSTL